MDGHRVVFPSFYSGPNIETSGRHQCHDNDSAECFLMKSNVAGSLQHCVTASARIDPSTNPDSLSYRNQPLCFSDARVQPCASPDRNPPLASPYQIHCENIQGNTSSQLDNKPHLIPSPLFPNPPCLSPRLPPFHHHILSVHLSVCSRHLLSLIITAA